MKGFFLRFTLLIFIILSISCGRNILEPESMPSPIDTIPGDIILKPIPSTTVFGGFGKRFVYQGKWHVLVNNVYNYNPNTKILTKLHGKSLIRLNDEENIEILGRDLDTVKPNNYSGHMYVWHLLESNNLVIENNIITLTSTTSVFQREIYIEGTIGWYTVSLYGSIDVFDSQNSVNWDYMREVQDLVKFPLPTAVGGTGGWQDGGIDLCTQGYYTYFKGYYYVFGGYNSSSNGFGDEISDTYVRIKAEDALDGSEESKWEIHDREFGREIVSNGKVSKDGETLFLDVRGSSTYLSTTDGENWTDDTLENYNAAVPNNNWMAGSSIAPTPLEPNWAKSTKNSYYKIDEENHYVPIPYDDIKAAAGRGDTSFTLTEKHKNSYNNFLVSSEHPDNATDIEDWKSLEIINEINSSIHWTSSPKYLFAFGDKFVRFIDYDAIGENISNGNKYRDDALKNYQIAYGNKEYDKAMIYKAKADMISSVLDSNIKDVYPHRAISHHLLEFNH